ncbi:TRAP transporter large permease [Chloroflexota bacterium]
MEFIGIGALLLLALAGAPIYLAVFVGATLIVLLGMGSDPIVIPSVMFNKINAYILIAVPMFLLSGQLIARGGGIRPLANLLTAFMGQLPGGPAYAIVVSCVIFSAMSSSSMAGVAGLAPVAIPLLVGLGYSKRFAIGLVLASASMADIIPPSVSLIFYGYITETSVITLWTAAIIPGIAQAALIMVTVFIHSRRGHYQRLPSVSWSDRWKAIKEGWPILIMPAAVLGPLYGGVGTPTEVASIAVVYSLILGLFVYRGLNLRQLWEACRWTVIILTAIFAILMAAFLLNLTLVYVRIPFMLRDALANSGVNWVAFMGIMFIAYLIMGAFLDASSILLISVPLVLTTILALGISPIMYGIFTVNCTELAFLTPPYGLLLFATASILKEKYTTIIKSVLLFYPALIIHPILIAYIPQMTLWLPKMIGR